MQHNTDNWQPILVHSSHRWHSRHSMVYHLTVNSEVKKITPMLKSKPVLAF